MLGGVYVIIAHIRVCTQNGVTSLAQEFEEVWCESKWRVPILGVYIAFIGNFLKKIVIVTKRDLDVEQFCICMGG